jgi:3'-5' exoribonuclease
MPASAQVVTRLSDVVDGQEAVCFAALVKKSRGTTKANQPFIKCLFRDNRVSYEAPLWHDHRYFADAEGWSEGLAYRLQLRASFNLRFGMQIEILGIRPAVEDDAADGYDFNDLVESTNYKPQDLIDSIHNRVHKFILQPHLKQLVLQILKDHDDLLRKMPAAQCMHQNYTGGLLEHVWSMSRVGEVLVEHYGRYYGDLNPPLDKGMVIAAIILHDIGKLRELRYHPVEARYTKEGCLVGHVLMGRDLVRETARTIEGYPEEDLLMLEHAILAHHGKREFGAPILPQTIEALLVSYIDDLDAKMNVAARQRLLSKTEDEFTDKAYALDNRRIYKGIPLESPDDDGSGAF